MIREEMDAIGGQEMLDAGARARRAVGEDRPHPRSPSSSGCRTAAAATFVLSMTHEETVTFHFSELGSYRDLPKIALPLPDEGPRRAAPARWAPARAGVHHEGRLLVRPRRGRPRRQLPEAQGRVRPHLRALRDRGLRGAGRVGDDGRQRVDRLPGAVGLGREHARHLRERRLRGRSRDRARRAAGAGRSPSRSTSRSRSRRPGSPRSRSSPASSASTRRRRRRRCR